MGPSNQDYYYADDRQIPLTPDSDLLAIDISQLPAKYQKTESVIRKRGRSLRRKVYLVNRTDVPEDLLSALEGTPAIQTVYRHEETILVILPEVRIEVDSQEKQGEVTKWIKRHDLSAKLVENSRGRMVIKPVSGCGADALSLANKLHEELDVGMAQARMLRVAKSPLP